MVELKDILIKELSSEFVCNVCMDYLFDHDNFHTSKAILQCSNGCVHCLKCWTKHFETSKKNCLTCREPIESIESLSKNIILKKQFGNKKIQCPNICFEKSSEKDEVNGCKEVIKIEDCFSHLSKCNHRYISCTMEGCTETFRALDLDKHLEKCGFASIDCEHCEMKIKKFAVKEHIDNDCSKTIIKCKYSDGGCKAEFKREDADNHIKDVDHKEFIQNIIDQHKEKHEVIKRKYEDTENRLVTAEKKLAEFDQIAKKLKINCENLTSRIDSTEKYQCNWVIYNYSEKFRTYPNGAMFASPAFWLGSYKFNCELYLNGYKDYSDFLSIFLFKKNHPESSVQARYSFELVNRNPSKSVKYSNSSTFDKDLGYGFGSFRYYKKVEINEESGFVVDNKIIFNIVVDISPPTSSNVLISQ
ncbi:hypothetical protein DICPUDRAFT_49369 [Dictyostelium purpureum]|uniref:TRAF-type domain-containing protein n=1 Tax=Dictyostelium purpureum TaxID=5786 RepID=F0ZTG9_DICPU|nr:uncharacterized protein DICPUDRAFT_49369 [Dictyostelium purpureum]EGC32748.1 hypothetical protein DICPUDRAFT_49369 [Dictyostelium purpureum]|eukprot:XP_003290711.1 hypothetical protein DICPUDRAFT_49369 [Dictyostelium purpureum]